MLKHDTKNYVRQFKKTFNVSFQCNATYTDLLMRNYVWLGQLNICAKYGVLSDKCIDFIE